MATNQLRQLGTVDMTESASTALRPLQEQIEQANASGRTPVVTDFGYLRWIWHAGRFWNA
jgi:hypothetical protein